MGYEFSGLTTHKKKKYVENKLKYGEGVPANEISGITFGKKRKDGFYRFKARTK